jgi:hypothetical protein
MEAWTRLSGAFPHSADARLPTRANFLRFKKFGQELAAVVELLSSAQKKAAFLQVFMIPGRF